MNKDINIKSLHISFVFRHRWDRPGEYNTDFSSWKIGVFFRKNRIVGQKNFNNPKLWKNNLVNDYMFGLDLLIISMWINFDLGGKHLILK